MIARIASPARVDGILAVSRGFGDFWFKEDKMIPPDEQKVIPVPDVFEVDAQIGDMVVLACDGVFDVLSSRRVAALVANASNINNNLVTIAAIPASEALNCGTDDNVTCAVILVGGMTGSWLDSPLVGSMPGS
jgi:serine/threonine protein phosphatase PrpC